MNLEERVVAAEVASRRADGPGVIEVQSQLRSDVAGQGLGPGTQWSGRPVRPGMANRIKLWRIDIRYVQIVSAYDTP